MKITAISGVLVLLCSTVHGQVDVSVFPTTKRPITIGDPITRFTLPITLPTVKPPINTCTNTVTVFQTIIPPPVTLPPVTLPPITLPRVTVTVTNTTIIAGGTITITQPCTTTSDPCPNPCEVTKTVDDCKIDRNCTPTVFTTTTGCKCPEVRCSTTTVVTTCITCPPLGTKTASCSTQSITR